MNSLHTNMNLISTWWKINTEKPCQNIYIFKFKKTRKKLADLVAENIQHVSFQWQVSLEYQN